MKSVICGTPPGLILDLEVYQGKETSLENSVTLLGVEPSVVVRFA